MTVSRKDAIRWFEFFASLPEDEELMADQTEIAYAVLGQIEDAVESQNRILEKEIKGLRSLSGRTFYVGDSKKFPRGCKSCLLGSGLSAVRKSNKCNANCKFCYDFGQLDDIPPIGEGMWEIGGTKFREEDIDLLLDVYDKPTGISYVYLEPFTEIEKYYGVVKKFRDAGIYQHLYTNGISATEKQLAALGDSGLDEIRFNLGASNCSDKVISHMKIAKKYIPMVGIETPMTPEFYSAFLKKKEKVFDAGPDFINCAELHLNENNIGNYYGENLYMYRLGYVSPVWSRSLTLRFMKIADDEKWPLVVHDCSNRTKFARDLNLKAKEGGWFGDSSYGCEFYRIPFEYFLPVLKDESFKM
ncbi:MAG: radical SAM protein [Clostridia bacterium]|nr:radical SAM protein [Clostridia bacterium]